MFVIVSVFFAVLILVGLCFAIWGVVQSPKTQIYAQYLYRKFIHNVYEEEDKNAPWRY